MDFSWTEEQLKFKQAVIEFAEKNLTACSNVIGLVNSPVIIGENAPISGSWACPCPSNMAAPMPISSPPC